MSERQPVGAKNIDIYGNPPIPWPEVRAALAAQQGPEVPFFLSTVRPDGRLHSAGIGPTWFDGDLFFSSNLRAQKARNLAAHPGCTLSGRVRGFDVTIEGRASRVTDLEILEQVAARYREGGWPAEVEGDALTAPYSAPSAGPAPWNLFRMEFGFVTALKLDDAGGAMLWSFDEN